jgi:hypothetical protein
VTEALSRHGHRNPASCKSGPTCCARSLMCSWASCIAHAQQPEAKQRALCASSSGHSRSSFSTGPTRDAGQTPRRSGWARSLLRPSSRCGVRATTPTRTPCCWPPRLCSRPRHKACQQARSWTRRSAARSGGTRGRSRTEESSSTSPTKSPPARQLLASTRPRSPTLWTTAGSGGS